MHPLSVSHAYKCGFKREFIWQGTNDHTAYHTLIEALRFRQRIGHERAMKYMSDLAHWAGNYLVTAWNTRMVLSEAMWPGSMRVVVLPNSQHYTSEMVLFVDE